MSIRQGNNIIAGSVSLKGTVGQIIQSTIPLNDAGLHLLDGSVISSGAYSDFISYIASLTTVYPDMFETEENWQTSVATYGVCGKFVYDSVNGTVRLPKITGFIEGATDATTLGDLVEAGLPNITGTVNIIPAQTVTPNITYGTGAFSKTVTGSSGQCNSGGNIQPIIQPTFDASDSNSTYGNSTTVQPQAIKVLYYIVIANTIKAPLGVDVADTDASNFTATGKEIITSYAMPSVSYIDLSVGSSGSAYTAPADGYYYAKGTSGGTWQELAMVCTLADGTSLDYASNCWSPSGNDIHVIIPVRKGAVVAFYHSANVSVFRFIYAKGEI